MRKTVVVCGRVSIPVMLGAAQHSGSGDTIRVVVTREEIKRATEELNRPEFKAGDVVYYAIHEVKAIVLSDLTYRALCKDQGLTVHGDCFAVALLQGKYAGDTIVVPAENLKVSSL